MRHRMSGRQLNRNGSSRVALLRSLAVALLKEETIKTTLPKAKELRVVAERLITLAKNNDTVAGRRLVFARTRNRDIVTKLFNDIAKRCESRQGGYTRILKCGLRPGDMTQMAYVQLVDQPAPKADEVEAAE